MNEPRITKPPAGRRIREWLAEQDLPVAVFPKEYDPALLGYIDMPVTGTRHAVYDRAVTEQIVLLRQRCTREEAAEWVDFNMESGTPAECAALFLETCIT